MGNKFAVRGASLRGANLHDADLKMADLWTADLSRANLSGANLEGANLAGANLDGANLDGANLEGANLSKANLSKVNLEGADLSVTDLSAANLSAANLTWVNLRGADLAGANLDRANLIGADLSGARGLLSPHEFIATLEKDHLGVIVYKRIGNTEFNNPDHWTITAGAYIDEVCNYDRCATCACGVNVGTKEWCSQHYVRGQLWRCRIRWMDLAAVCVPYGTEGKFRAGRVELLEMINPSDKP